MTSNLALGNLASVASLLAATLFQVNPDRNHKFYNVVSNDSDVLSIYRCCWNVATMESSKWENITIIELNEYTCMCKHFPLRNHSSA